MGNKKLRFAAISRLNCSHHIDHFAPLCDLMDAPFLTSEDLHLELAQKFYPNLKTEYVDACILNPEYLKERYDVILHSFFWGNLLDFEFSPGKKTSKRKLRCVFTPHGNSDKGYHCEIFQNYALNDISLLYGEHMEDMLKRMKVSLKEPLRMGNVRYTYYQKYRSFFDEIAQKEIFSKIDPKKKTLLYAPTWKDYENNTSIFDSHSFILEKLPAKYNLIVKLHPWLGTEANWTVGNNSLGKLFHILAKYETTPGVIFLTDFPPTYSLLAGVDIYLGDLSSIGYDFLVFNRPMFFFRPPGRAENDPSLFLHQCGTVIDQGEKILEIIEQGLEKDSHYAKRRQEIYEYAFGPEKKSEYLKEELLSLCRKKK